MTTPSDFAGKACEGQKIKQLPFSKLITKYNDFLSGLNLNHCVIDKHSGSQSSSYSGSSLGGLLMTVHGQESSSYKRSHVSGCSGVNTLLQTYNNTVQNVKCIISQDTTNITVSVSEGNKITINVGGNFTSDCPISQTISGTVDLYTQISNTSSNVIKAAVNNHIQNFTSQLRNMYNGQPQYSKSGEGTQNVNQILQSSTQNDVDNQVNDRINTFNKSIFANQVFTLNVGGDLTLFAGSGMCGSITQDIQLDIISSSIVQGAFTAALKNIDISSLLPPLPFTPVDTTTVKKSSNSNYLIWLLLIVAIATAIYWFYIRNKNKKV